MRMNVGLTIPTVFYFKVKEGMQVETRTPEVMKSVRFVLELIRSSHPYACSTCDADSTCTLQDLWYRYQVSKENIPPGVEKVYQQHHEWDSCPVDSEPDVAGTKRASEYVSHGSFNAIQFDMDKVSIRACRIKAITAP